jgi:hypothetical protein
MATKNSGSKNRTHVEQSRKKRINGVLQTCNVPLHAVSEVQCLPHQGNQCFMLNVDSVYFV